MLLPLFKSLADETRLRLLNLLSHGEFTVQDLTEILAMGQSRISRHLKILLDIGLVTVKRQGTWSYYRVATLEGWRELFWDVMLQELRHIPSAHDDLVRMGRQFERKRLASRDFFDRHARQWDMLKKQTLPLVSYETCLLEFLGSGQMLVEVGIGTGELLPRLQGRWENVIGIDQSAAMLEEAHRRAVHDNCPDLELRLGEMGALPVGDVQADAVLMNMVLHHVHQPLPVLKDAARILRPGGRLVLADMTQHTHDWTREALADVWLGFTQEEVRGWLAEIGFEKMEIKSIAKAGHLSGVILAVASHLKTPQGDE